MTKNDVVHEMANMILSFDIDKNEKGVGLWLGDYWLTPGTCYELASLIVEVNNEDYGVGNWSLEMPAIQILRNHGYQNDTDN